MSEEVGEDEDLILSEPSDSELAEQMHDDLYDGLGEEIAEGTQILLDRDWQAKRVLLAANAMKVGMAILKSVLAETGAEPVASIGLPGYRLAEH